MDYIVYEQVEKVQLVFSGATTYFGILEGERYPITESMYHAHMAYFARECKRRFLPNKALEAKQ